MLSILLQKNKNSVHTCAFYRQIARLSPRDGRVKTFESKTEDHAICNKSNLLNHHRNLVHYKNPYEEPNSWIHLTEKYQRKLFGRYGFESRVNPRICFISISASQKTSYEEVADSDSIESLINKFKSAETNKNEKILQREEQINKKLEKLNQWKHELNSRINKKRADAIAAKEKKDRLIEEVRRHFGYKIDPKDERFKELLEQKEREDKKKQKEAKRKAKEQKLMSKLVEKSISMS